MTTKRFDFPMPFGWYQLAYSIDIEPGQSKPMHYFGQEMVMFRGEDGRVRVLDAYCPHLGAHLGYGIHQADGGGKVEGNNIVCPFHSWKFNGDGQVEEIPYAKNIPPKVKGKQCIRSWHVEEKNQVIWIWYHPDKTVEPLWEVVAIPEADDPSLGWSRVDRSKVKTWRMKTIPQEVAENSVDYAHFLYVHQVKSDPTAEANYNEHHCKRVVKTNMQTPKGIVEGCIDSENWGPGQSQIRFTGITETLLFGNLIPVDEELVEINFTFFQPLVNGETPTGGVQEAIIKDLIRQLNEDQIIWEKKIYRAQPTLCDGDGPIARFRKYYSQFYAS
jgi:3-ketosteroid 9alpha-monooxygenase subunit A